MRNHFSEHRAGPTLQTREHPARPCVHLHAPSRSFTQPSNLLVDEVVIRHTISSVVQTASEAHLNEDIAPAPLLSNFGAAVIGKHIGDMSMMNLLNAKQRTLDELISLGSVC